LSEFERGFSAVERLECDILLTPHPEGSGLWERVAATARQRLGQRVASERGR
jgi:hypothetical protein